MNRRSLLKMSALAVDSTISAQDIAEYAGHEPGCNPELDNRVVLGRLSAALAANRPLRVIEKLVDRLLDSHNSLQFVAGLKTSIGISTDTFHGTVVNASRRKWDFQSTVCSLSRIISRFNFPYALALNERLPDPISSVEYDIFYRDYSERAVELLRLRKECLRRGDTRSSDNLIFYLSRISADPSVCAAACTLLLDDSTFPDRLETILSFCRNIKESGIGARHAYLVVKLISLVSQETNSLERKALAPLLLILRPLVLKCACSDQPKDLMAGWRTTDSVGKMMDLVGYPLPPVVKHFNDTAKLVGIDQIEFSEVKYKVVDAAPIGRDFWRHERTKSILSKLKDYSAATGDESLQSQHLDQLSILVAEFLKDSSIGEVDRFLIISAVNFHLLKRTEPSHVLFQVIVDQNKSHLMSHEARLVGSAVWTYLVERCIDDLGGTSKGKKSKGALVAKTWIESGNACMSLCARLSSPQ